MQNELRERVNSWLNDLNSNSNPRILNTVDKLEKYGAYDYRIIYALREYAASARTFFLQNRAMDLAEKLETLAGKSLDRPISDLSDRQLLERITLEQLNQRKQLRQIYAF